MTSRAEAFTAALDRASVHARSWLASMPDRTVPPQRNANEIVIDLGGPLPEGPTPAADVIDLLAEGVGPGLMAMPSGRFFGWVIGGAMPAALAADWLTSAWDQNTGMRFATSGTSGAEEAASSWILDLLGLPSNADVGFVTGGTMANFTGLAARSIRSRPRQRWHTARGVGARRRRLRALGRSVTAAAAPRRGVRGRRLVGHGCAQDPQRAPRLRHLDRRPPAVAARSNGHAGQLSRARRGTW